MPTLCYGVFIKRINRLILRYLIGDFVFDVYCHRERQTEFCSFQTVLRLLDLSLYERSTKYRRGVNEESRTNCPKKSKNRSMKHMKQEERENFIYLNVT